MHLDKSVVAAGTFFLVMAIIVPPALRAHWGMQGIFLAMMLALVLSFLVSLAWTRIREKMPGKAVCTSVPAPSDQSNSRKRSDVIAETALPLLMLEFLSTCAVMTVL